VKVFAYAIPTDLAACDPTGTVCLTFKTGSKQRTWKNARYWIERVHLAA
jgi:hypothetical protein